MQKEIIISTSCHNEFIDITAKVEKIVHESNIETGICSLYVPHATAGLTINENADPNICTDIIKAVNKAVPEHDNYLHDSIDNNAAAHIKSSIISPSITVPIKDKSLALGTWQDIFFTEWDGPRSQRRIIITIIGG